MEKGIERISKLLESAHTDAAVFPPTILYNEGWMLRIVLSLQSEGIKCLPINFQPGAKWFSEALIDSPFLPRFRGAPLAEGLTHLDGAIGHFDIRPGTKTGIVLRTDSTQFVAIEAKMFSPLSKGTKNAPNYDQAARIVACIAWEISNLSRTPRRLASAEEFESLGFYVIAPREQIREDVFSSQVSKSSIKRKVEHRIDAYSDDPLMRPILKVWYDDSFIPTLERIDIRCVPWETVMDKIDETAIQNFYTRCLKFNMPREREGDHQ